MNITLNSTCEHHFLPIVGVAHVAYIPEGRVVGLSKLNRIVDHYAKRPQVQERLSRQVLKALQELLGTQNVAVVMDAKHLCVSSRGIQDEGSSTVTASYGGTLRQRAEVRASSFNTSKNEFFRTRGIAQGLTIFALQFWHLTTGFRTLLKRFNHGCTPPTPTSR